MTSTHPTLDQQRAKQFAVVGIGTDAVFGLRSNRTEANALARRFQMVKVVPPTIQKEYRVEKHGDQFKVVDVEFKSDVRYNKGGARVTRPFKTVKKATTFIHNELAGKVILDSSIGVQ